MEFKVLTPEEIQTLQVDAALRLVGEYTVILSKSNREISDAILNLGQAKNAVNDATSRLQQARNDKQTIIEMLRSLKVICERA